jgi:hypothetical protein
MRPASIVNFERLYLGAIVVGIINTILSWEQAKATLAAQPNSAILGPDFLYIVAALSILVPLLLWYFIAKKASVVAKWILVVLFLLGLIGTLMTIQAGTYPQGIYAALTALTTLLQAGAVWMLFRPDAKAWFADGRGDPQPDTRL